jgi:CRISPR-associated protein Csx3
MFLLTIRRLAMVNLLPAILLGGPPHAGKSVLLYNLTQALRERGVRHHAIRACPDGEGNWFQEGEPESMSKIRAPLTGVWPASFIERISFNVEHRCLPFLVDMGGSPQTSELPMFRHCTHAILLLKENKPEATQRWRSMVDEANLLLLAQLTSQLVGTSTISNYTIPLEGSITGLERQSTTVREDDVFKILAEHVEDLFKSFSPHDLEQTFLEQAPSEWVIDAPTELRPYTPSIWWKREMLAPFLASLPQQVPLSVHGVGPNWLYAALATHAPAQPFYLFDPKLPSGWILPAKVCFGTEYSPEMTIELRQNEQMTVLKITLLTKRLEYFQPDPFPFPHINTEKGLIIDGPLPYWLLTPLMRLYQETSIPWIAVHYVPDGGAVITYSRVATQQIGELVKLPS